MLETPALLPALWSGVSSGLFADELRRLGTQAIQVSTYVLMLRPGIQVVADSGGAHHFTGWAGPLATDAGRFPSELAERARVLRVDDEGLTLTSFIDGSRHRLTPERSIELQEALGADIMLSLDDPRELGERRTREWARRSLAARTASGGLLFARVTSAAAARQSSDLELDGAVLDPATFAADPNLALPERWVRYARDVDGPLALLAGVQAGLDLFDSAAPWRLARQGAVYTSQGLMLRVESFDAAENDPIEVGCGCLACNAGFARGYLRHLVTANELLAYTLLGAHNVFVMHDLLRRVRAAVASQTLAALVEACRGAYTTPQTDRDP